MEKAVWGWFGNSGAGLGSDQPIWVPMNQSGDGGTGLGTSELVLGLDQPIWGPMNQFGDGGTGLEMVWVQLSWFWGQIS